MKQKKIEKKQKNKVDEINHKKKMWQLGKLIEPTRSTEYYTSDFTLQLSARLYECIKKEIESCNGSEEKFINEFRKYKSKIQKLILLWNSNTPHTREYGYLKLLLETYWDFPQNLLNCAVKYDK